MLESSTKRSVDHLNPKTIMKFKSKPIKVEHHNNQDCLGTTVHHRGGSCGSSGSASGSDLDINETVSSISPRPATGSLTTAAGQETDCHSPADLTHLTKLPSPSPISKSTCKAVRKTKYFRPSRAGGEQSEPFREYFIKSSPILKKKHH